MTKIEQIIKRNNAKWRKATASQRRKMLVRDALKQVRAKKFKPEECVYVRAFKIPNEANTQERLLDPKHPTCRVCARGALFLSHIRLRNQFTGDPSRIDSSEIDKAVGWPVDNLNAIETAFEIYLTGDRSDLTDSAYAFGVKYDNLKERLIAILKNILASKDGLFHP